MPIDAAIVKDLAIACAAVVTAGAAVTTAVVAVRGIRKWRDELGGKAAFDCARAVARAGYQLRNAIRDCRAMFISVAEFPPPTDDAEFQSTHERRANEFRHAYRARFERVTTALTNLDTAALEAEALWGSEIENKIAALRACVFELRAYIEAFIRNEERGGESFLRDEKFRKKTEMVIWDTGDENGYNIKLAAVIKNIESELRPHLARKS